MDFSHKMNTREAAAYLGRSTGWLAASRTRLNIPAYRIGRSYTYIKEELDAWIATQKVTSSVAYGSHRKNRSHRYEPITL